MAIFRDVTCAPGTTHVKPQKTYVKQFDVLHAHVCRVTTRRWAMTCSECSVNQQVNAFQHKNKIYDGLQTSLSCACSQACSNFDKSLRRHIGSLGHKELIHHLLPCPNLQLITISYTALALLSFVATRHFNNIRHCAGTSERLFQYQGRALKENI